MFANNEMGAWEKVFSMVNFPNARDILHDTGDSNEIGVYTGSVESLIERIGLNSKSGQAQAQAEQQEALQ
jgi:hypothetical protein